MRLTLGLPRAANRDREFLDAIALYVFDPQIRNRTLIARVANSHDLSMVVDALQSDRLLQLCRWVNCNWEETHP